MDTYTYKDLVLFLKNASDLKKIKFHTARTRTTAIKRIFADSTFADVDVLDVDIGKVIAEFSEKNKDISSDTINSYRTRFNSSLKDFIRYEVLGEAMPVLEKVKIENIPKRVEQKNSLGAIDLPCPIRNNKHIVSIKNLPMDLTKEELNRLVSLVKDFLGMEGENSF
jgi:hypothetical protein